MVIGKNDIVKGAKILKEKGPYYFWDHALKKIGIREELITSQKLYEYYKSLNSNQYEYELIKWYLNATGENLNLDNPKTFNEKLQWLKIYDSTPLKTKLADKYLVREWFASQIGEQYLVPLIGVWDKFEDIDFDLLPRKFALKANHGSGWNVIVSDKDKMNYAKTKEKFDRWMSMDFSLVGGFELYYKVIPPKIIAEQFLENTQGLIDYRFYCFNGEPKQTWVDIFSGTPNHKREIYDTEWNKMPIKCKWPNANGLLDKKPDCYDEMLTIARKLSKDFAFVRVDFYEVEAKIYMGEMTFNPMSGIGEIEPLEYDLIMGDMIKLPTKK